ncbi:MAG: hypothetical protein JW861_02635 [Bacteroidales bacterium]|nr:hypothetical protein [Bacteroidales bacterium]
MKTHHYLGAFLLASAMATASLFAQQNPFLPKHLRIAINGMIVPESCGVYQRIVSENGLYTCTFTPAFPTDEDRLLNDFKLFRDGQLKYILPVAPGADAMVSNSGKVVFFNMAMHHQNMTRLVFLDENGGRYAERSAQSPDLFLFSPDGNSFAWGGISGLHVLDLENLMEYRTSGGFRAVFSHDGSLLAVSTGSTVTVFRKNMKISETALPSGFIRGMAFSNTGRHLAMITRHDLWIADTELGTCMVQDHLEGNHSFRDVLEVRNGYVAGIHYRDDRISQGFWRSYDYGGELISEGAGEIRLLPDMLRAREETGKRLKSGQIPWPFVPFDTTHTVWNYYEQHMGDGSPDWSYLHQGLDIITPIGEPVYAVEEGWVKCVLTIGGASYWRTAISPEQVSGYSDGWLYAHLIESTIQFDVADYVHLHDYLGDIIEWTWDWGHIHFVEIRDIGTVWSFDDNEWGINFNPLLALVPNTDLIPPQIEPVFSYSKFGFCQNESNLYLAPDDLYGDVDIFVKASDYFTGSEWEQPAFKTYYWITRPSDGDTILHRTLGQVLNHPYSFYDSYHYEEYAPLLYKKGGILTSPPWMSEDRNYYQILTNNNGDTILDLNEKNLAFSTASYTDGIYRIFVEIWDEYGNMDADSMDVTFSNGISSLPGNETAGNARIFPNPADGNVEISLPAGKPYCGFSWEAFDTGMKNLFRGSVPDEETGFHIDVSGWPRGLYFIILKGPDFFEPVKLTVIHP